MAITQVRSLDDLKDLKLGTAVRVQDTLRGPKARIEVALYDGRGGDGRFKFLRRVDDPDAQQGGIEYTLTFVAPNNLSVEKGTVVLKGSDRGVAYSRRSSDYNEVQEMFQHAGLEE